MAQTSYLLPLLLTVVTVIFFTTTKAQDRAPHGLIYENPTAFSPSAYNFFHPNAAHPPSIQDACNDESNCSPLPVAATSTVQSSLAEQSSSRNDDKRQNKVGAGAVVGVIFGFILVVLVAMGAYYVVTTRRSNSRQESTIMPSA